MLSLLNVRHILTKRPIENPRLADRLEELTRTPITIYRNPEALPRVLVLLDAPDAVLLVLAYSECCSQAKQPLATPIGGTTRCRCRTAGRAS